MAVTQAQVISLYLAYFGRPPDFDGLQFYTNPTKNFTIDQIAQGFSASQESKDLYGPSFGAAQVDAIYMNLFNRHAEPGGIAYWVNEVNSGHLSPAMAAWGIFVGAQGTDAQTRDAKMQVATSWVLNVDTSPEIVGYSGAAAVAVARTFLASVDYTNLSVKLPLVPTTLASAIDANHSSNGLASDVNTVVEGNTVYFTYSTTSVPAGTVFNYVITGVQAADIAGGQLTGTATIDAQGKAVVGVTVLRDNLVETEAITMSIGGATKSVNVTDNPPTFTLGVAGGATSVDEGNAAVFTLTTDGAAPGSQYDYVISGVSAADVVGGQLTGVATVGNDGKATIQIPIAADNVTEGVETLTLSVAGQTKTIVVNDTSKDPVPTMQFTPSSTSVAEGGQVTFTLQTTNIAAGTVINYTLAGSTGINAADIVGGSLTGTATVGNDGKATIVVGIANDNIANETDTLQISASYTKGANTATASSNVTVNDTTPTYTLTPATSAANEGQTAVFQLQTTNVSAGTVLNYTLSGSGITATDVVGGQLTGTGVVGNDGKISISVPIAADNFTEGTETLTLSIAGQTSTVVISDTSKDPLPSLQLTPSATSVNEGSQVVFTLQTTNIAPGTVINYTLSGNGTTAADVVGGLLTGSTTVGNDGKATIVVTEANDLLPNETDTLLVTATYTDRFSTQFTTSTSVTVNDMTPVYTLTGPSSGNEGDTLIFSLGTTHVVSGTQIAYSLTGSNLTQGDITGGALSGVATVGNDGKAVVQVGLRADQITEGTETFTLSIAGQTQVFTVGDTSKTKYTITPSAVSVNEGQSITFTIDTTAPQGTTLNVALSGAGIATADFNNLAALTLQTVVDANGQAVVTIPVANDFSYHEGNEQLTFSITNPDNGPNPTATVLIVDTSVEQNSFTLTTGQDVITASQHDDTFYVANNTLGAGDNVDGSGGNDTMIVQIDSNYGGGGIPAPQPVFSSFALSNIENFTVTSDDQNPAALGGGAAVFDLSSSSGITNVTSNNSSRAVIFNELAGLAGGVLPTVNINNLTNTNNTTDVRVHYQDTALAGGSDVVTVNITTSQVNTLQLGRSTNALNNSGVETVVANINGNTTITTLDSDITNLSLNSGSANVTITNALNGTIRDVEAGSATGNISLSVAGATGGVLINTGSGSDNLTGSSNNDTINAGAGNNTIAAGGGADYVNVTTGNNSIDLGNDGNFNQVGINGSGNNTVTGYGGPDYVYITGNGANTLNLGDGNNYVSISGNGGNAITTLSGADTVTIGGNGSNGISTGAGNDSVNINGNGNNNVDAGADNDSVVISGTGNNTVNAGSGNDYVSTGSGDDYVLTGTGSDTVLTDGGNDIVDTNGAFSAFWSGVGPVINDSLDGGTGNNELRVENSTVDSDWRMAFNFQTLSVWGNVSEQLGGSFGGNPNPWAQNNTKIATINLQDSGDTTIDAGTFTSALTVNNNWYGNESVTTGHANDTINTGNGNDSFLTDADYLNGGAGSDTLNIFGPLWSYLSAANQISHIETWNLLPQNYSNGWFGSGYVYTITLNNVQAPDGNVLTVNGGTLRSWEGVYLDGNNVNSFALNVTTGASYDYVRGGTWNDTIATGVGSDTVDLTLGGNDSVTTGDDNDLVYLTQGTNNGNVNVNLGNGADTIQVNSATLNGNDTLNGGEADANDFVVTAGNIADAQLAHTTNFRNVHFQNPTNSTFGANAQAAGMVEFWLANGGSSTLNAGAYTAAVVNSHTGITVHGGDNADVITTGAGNDYVYTGGGTGNDTVSTGAGNDTVDGAVGSVNVSLGAGDDVLKVYGNELDASDTVAGGANATSTGDTILMMNSAGTITAVVDLNNVTGIENFSFDNDGWMNNFPNVSTNPNTIEFMNGNILSLQTININGGTITDTHDSLKVTWDNTLDVDFQFNVTGTAGNDTFIKQFGGGANNITINAGNGNDALRIHAGDLGQNILFDGQGGSDDVIQSLGGTFNDDDFVGVRNTEELASFNNAFLGANLGVTAKGAGLNILTTGTGGSNIVFDPLFNPTTVTVNTSSGVDLINAGASSSALVINAGNAGNVTAADNFTGGTTANDVMYLVADNGTADLTNVTAVERFVAVESGDNNITFNVADHTFTTPGADLSTITIDGTALDDLPPGDPVEGRVTVNAAGLSASHALSVKGGTGSDLINTGAGNDTVNLWLGDDTVNTGAGNDTVIQTMSASGAFDGNKTVDVGNGNNSVTLGNGNNTITGGTGTDAVTVGTGSNLINVGNGTNFVSQAGGGTGNNTITGGTGVDTVTLSGNGINKVDLGGGNDTFWDTSSGGGLDIITGGAGADAFHLGGASHIIRYTALNESWGLAATRDTVYGFDSAHDVIGLDAGILAGGVTDVNFAGNAPTSFEAQLAIAMTANDGKADYVYDQQLGLLLVDVNDDGVLNGQDLVIQMNGVVGNVIGNGDVQLIDYTPPAAPVITLVNDDVGPFTGPVTNGGVTDDNLVQVSGTTEANALVSLYDNGVLKGIVTADGGGNWVFNGGSSVSVAAGNHSLTAQAVDTSGNVGPMSGAFTFTVDNTAPTATVTDNHAEAWASISSIAAGGANPTTPGVIRFTFNFTENVTGFGDAGDVTVSGTYASAGSLVQDNAHQWHLDVTPTALTEATSVTVTLNAGTYTDAAGNAGGGGSDTQNYDTNAPTALTVALNNDTNHAGDGYTQDQTLVIGGEITVSSEQLEYSTDNGSTWNVYGSNLTGNVNLNLAEGAHALLFRQTDIAGNSSTATGVWYYYDITAPVITGVVDNHAEAVANILSLANTGGVVTFTFTTSEAYDPTSLTLGDFVTSGNVASVTNLQYVDATHFSVDLTPTAATDNGTMNVWLNAGALTDLAGNATTGASPTGTQDFDNKAPIITLAQLATNTLPPNDQGATVWTSDPSINTTADETVTWHYWVNGSGYSNTYNTGLLNNNGTGDNQVAVYATDSAGNDSVGFSWVMDTNNVNNYWRYDVLLITSTSPTDNGTVPAGNDLIATFNQNIAFVNSLTVAQNIQLIDLTNFNSLVATNISIINGNQLDIHPTAGLVAGHHYAVTIAPNTIEDSAWATTGGVTLTGYTGPTTWDFVAS